MQVMSSEAIYLPADRQILNGQTSNAPWDASTTGPGAALERPAPKGGRNARDVAFGLVMAGVVAIVLYAMWRGWVFGGH